MENTVKVKLVDRDIWGSIISEESFGDDRVVDLIAFLQGLLGAVPEKFRESTLIDISSYTEYDCSYTKLEIYYHRPETREEKQDRETFEKSCQERQRRADEEQLAKLKAKLGHA